MTITTKHFYPDTPHSLYCLSALEQIGYNARMSRKKHPAIADAGDSLMGACRSGNWFKAVEAAEKMVTECEHCHLGFVTEQLRRCIAHGNEMIARPYYAERSRQEIAA